MGQHDWSQNALCWKVAFHHVFGDIVVASVSETAHGHGVSGNDAVPCVVRPAHRICGCHTDGDYGSHSGHSEYSFHSLSVPGLLVLWGYHCDTPLSGFHLGSDPCIVIRTVLGVDCSMGS